MPPGVGNCPLVLTVSVLSAPPLGHGRVFDVRRGQGRIEEAQIYIRGRWQNGGGGVRVVEGVRVGHFSQITSARVRICDGRTGIGFCAFRPAYEGDATAMFCLRIARRRKHRKFVRGWDLATIGETDQSARDFGK